MQLPQTIEIKGIKVLTTKQIAEAYGTTKDKIIYNFILTRINIFLESIT